MVFQDKYCEKCCEEYTDTNNKWCKPCQINYLKKFFTNWTSRNEKIDNFIQKMQFEINNPWDTVFEWIPHNWLFDIEEINGDDFSTVYLAKWKNGPLHWNNKKYVRKSNIKVVLKYLHNLLNIDEFLNEV